MLRNNLLWHFILNVWQISAPASKMVQIQHSGLIGDQCWAFQHPWQKPQNTRININTIVTLHKGLKVKTRPIDWSLCTPSIELCIDKITAANLDKSLCLFWILYNFKPSTNFDLFVISFRFSFEVFWFSDFRSFFLDPKIQNFRIWLFWNVESKQT